MTNRGVGSGTCLGGLMAVFGVSLLVSSSWGATIPTTTFYGPSYDQVEHTTGSGQMAGGYLTIKDTANDFMGTYVKGTGSLTDYVVIYVDNSPGGFTDTTHFTDNGDAWRRAISGYSTVGTRSTLYFANGFTADYAIVLNGDYGVRVFHLSEGTFDDPATAYLTPMGDVNGVTHYIDVLWSSLGFADGQSHGFSFESTIVSGTGMRYLDSFERYTPDSRSGFGFSAWLENMDYFGVTPVPEMTTVSLAVFGGIAALAGSMPKIYRKVKSARG